jgi:hypothetical protein
MQKKMIKTLASLIAFAQLAHADTAQMRNLENRVSTLEQKKGASGMINPPGRPQVKDGVDLFIEGELLCWNAHENGLPVAVVNQGSSSNLSHAKIRTIHSDWDLGLRLALGCNLPRDGWDLSLSWLRLNTGGHKHINSGTNRAIFPSRTQPADPIPSSSAAKKAHSHWKLLINQLDLDLGREFFVSKWLTLRPHFGLRTAWIHQKWNTLFRNFNNTALPNRDRLKYRDHYWAMGPEMGIDTQWGLGEGWSIFSNVSGAILYGFHSIHDEEKDHPAQFTTSHSGKFVNAASKYRISHPVLDLMLGIRYDYMFYNDRFHLGLEIGWENHVYFSQNQFPVFTSNNSLGSVVSNQGDLTFQGWTVGARLDF